MRANAPGALGLVALMLCAGCVSVNRRVEKIPVTVVSEPAGAMVTQSNAQGRHALGPAPLDLELGYATDEIDVAPSIWIAPVVFALGTIAGGLILATDDGDQGLGLATTLVSAGGLFATGLASLIVQLQDGAVTEVGFVGGPTALEARLAGHTPAMVVLKHRTVLEPVKLSLFPTAEAEIRGALGDIQSPPARTTKPPIIAVFRVQDAGQQIPPPELAQLTTYLRTRLTETGRFRLVPEEALKAEFAARKAASYDNCVDEACQIELGKAVAAEKLLATTILRFGTACSLSARLFDLTSETTESAAAVRTDCDHGSILGAVEQLVQRLGRS